MTPYELRFQIFKQAYAMLQDDYCAKYQIAESINDGKVPKELYDEYPSLNDVLKQAEIINDFVSSK